MGFSGTGAFRVLYAGRVVTVVVEGEAFLAVFSHIAALQHQIAASCLVGECAAVVGSPIESGFGMRFVASQTVVIDIAVGKRLTAGGGEFVGCGTAQRRFDSSV